MHVFFLPDHELASLSGPNLKAIARYPHISMSRMTSVRQLLDGALHEAHLRVDVTCEVDHMSTAINMVRAGMGITVLPLSTLDSVSCEGLIHRPIKGNHLQRSIGVMTTRNRLLSPVAEAFSMALQDTEPTT